MVLPPRYNNESPQYSSLVERTPEGRPEMVTITPTRRGGSNVTETQIFETIADALRSMVTLNLIPYRHLWTRSNVSRSVTGILVMTNLSDSRNAHTEDLTVQDITTEMIGEIFHRASGAGSNPNLSIYNVEFAYWINPLSFQTGRGESKTIRTDGVWKPTLKTPSMEGYTNLNCAAAAIAFLLGKEGLYGDVFKDKVGQKRELKKWCRITADLMHLLQWEEEISVAQVGDFVKVFQDYRIVVVNSITKSSSTRDWKGDLYVANGENKILYLYHDPKEHHFFAISAIQKFIKQRKGRYYRWCYDCSSYTQSTCECGEQPYRGVPQRNCQHCGMDYSSKIKHYCFSTKCKGCQLFFNNQTNDLMDHRCPIFMNVPKKPLPFKGETEQDDEKMYNLWAYDIESALVFNDTLIPSYQTDAEGLFPTTHQIIEIKQSTQIPNLIIWMNVFTKELHSSESMDDFISFMLQENDGRNIAIAHNAKGYDGRLVFEGIKNFQENIEVHPLMRGTQMIRLKVGNTIFQDSLLHLSGSLAGLAEDFLKGSGIDLEKGEFPHFFNREEYRNYVGPLPGDEFYDLKFTLRDDAALARHQRFRAKWEGRTDWDAEKNLYEYCKNDVLILAEIIYLHHKQCLDILNDYNPAIAVSPWNFTTAAGYMHRLFLMEQSLSMPETKDPQVIKEVVQNSWAALTVNEHYFAKLALRGGRTEVRKFYHQIQEGETIKCVDVHSMYPSIQIGKEIQVGRETIPLLFPVGTPTIEIHDPAYYPCNLHFMNPQSKCNCSLEVKQCHTDKKITVIPATPSNLHHYIENFDGIIMVDATPPQMYHPILPVFDEKTGKCNFSCEPIVGKTFASPALKVAIHNGYVVTKIYRADRYKLAPSKWKGLLGSMYKMKYYSSSDGDIHLPNETVEECQKRHQEFYRNHFGIELDFTQCKKRKALKISSKVLINSPWGKHAESVDHTQCKIIDTVDYMASEEFLNQIDKRQVKVKDINLLGRRTMIRFDAIRQWKEKIVRPDLHKGYLPCAVFVPMYGQLMTWNSLQKVGERALMCDTDSVKYISKPGLPDIPVDNCLGTWEDEGNLKEFVSIGLKSYGLRYAEGNKESIKIKGCSIKRSHRNLLNFDTMKCMLLYDEQVSIPQLSFDYTMTVGIRTREYLKLVKFDPNILKGQYNRTNYQLYPFGYSLPNNNGTTIGKKSHDGGADL